MFHFSTTTNTDKKSEPQLKSTEPKAEQQLRSPLFQKNKKKKTMTSGSSSNSSPTSVPKVHRGEWVNNTDPVSQHPNPQDEKPDSPTSTSSNEKPPKIPAHAPPSTGSSLTRSTRYHKHWFKQKLLPFFQGFFLAPTTGQTMTLHHHAPRSPTSSSTPTLRDAPS